MPINKKKILTITVFILMISFSLLLRNLPSPKTLANFPYPKSSQIYDRNGNLLYELHGDQNRFPVKLDELPQHLIDATITIEDKNFYEHHGFDFKGIGRAIVNIIFKQRMQGGSTITQQLVKNALLTPERTLQRKIKEAFLTVLTEVIYNKNEILEMYLNQIPYGGVSYGVEAASRMFFDKSARDLNLAESALIAGLPAATTTYSPFIHPKKAKQRQELILQKMLEQKKISKEEYEKAKQNKLVYAKTKSEIKAPHFVFYVKEKLIEKYGDKITQQGGLKVKTTLDLNIQESAEKIVREEIEKLKKANVSNGAALITNPKNGEILAMIGSKDYFADDIDGKFNVTTALRQPGSAIKPLNYVVGLDLGNVTPSTVFADIPTCFSGGPKLYCPKNYDGLFHGPTQVRYALGNSFNIPAVRMLALNGLETFIASASAAGLESIGNRDPSEFGLSLTLGGGEVKMTEMATAFGTLANAGIRKDLISILEIKDQNNNVLERKKENNEKRIFSRASAYLVNHILLDNNARSAAFGSNSWLVIDNHPEVSVKTGTTNDKRDNWTIGYTPSFLTVVWVGNNDNTPMGWVASGVTGASPIWNKIMTSLLKDKKQEWPNKPHNITGTSVCNLTGQKSIEGQNCESRYEFFMKQFPPQTKPLKQVILIDKDTQQPVQPGEDIENTEYQEHQVVIDPLGTVYCFDCPPREKPVIIN